MPPSYWVDVLQTTTYLLNRHTTKTLAFQTPFFALYGTQPSYSHMRVFGCPDYSNLSCTTDHKLTPQSTACVFLGYPSEHRGCRCLNLSTNRLIISCHVTFNKTSFPFFRSHHLLHPTLIPYPSLMLFLFLLLVLVFQVPLLLC